MKLTYNFVRNIIVCCMLLSVTFYFNIDNTKLSDLIGNTFAGLVTGLILAVLSNIKLTKIREYEDKISDYNATLQIGSKAYEMIYKLEQKSNRDIFEVINLYSDILTFFLQCNNTEIVNVLKLKQNINIEMLMKEIEEKMGDIDISQYGDEIYINSNEYKEKHKKYLVKYIRQILQLKVALRDDIKNLENRKDKLQKSSI